MELNNTQNDIEAKKAKIRKRIREGNAENADYIPAKEIPKIFESDVDMRVAVYARVSTGNLQQTSSQAMQEEYYADFVERQEGWSLVKIYSEACGIIEPTQRSPKTLGLRRVGSNYTIGAAQPQL